MNAPIETTTGGTDTSASVLSVTERVRAQALALGFHRVGVARARPLDEELPALRAFIEAGFHGELAWLARDPEVRVDPTHAHFAMTDTRSVLVCALAYRREEGPEAQGPAGGRIARYARGRDYHNFLRKKLRRLAAWIRATFEGVEAKPAVDTSPVLERAWAQRAGVGFVGKNGLVIAPGLGSYVLLGELITNLELAVDDPLESRCGSCTLCLEACPTGAFVRPFVLDARKCVSYLTIEAPGLPDESLREGLGDRLFGCDDCQDACPYNRTAPPDARTTTEFAHANRFKGVTLRDLLGWDEARFRAVTLGSPLARPGRAGIARNAAMVLGNTGGSVEDTAALTRAASEDEDAGVREAAAWALARIARRAER